MADTVVRVYNLTPDDIQVGRAAGPDDEVVLHLGDTVTIQGVPDQLDALLGIAQLRIDDVQRTMRPRTDEPF